MLWISLLQELEEQRRLQKLDEERRQQEVEQKKLREIEEQKKLEEQRRLQEIEEQKRLHELEEQKRLQELEEKQHLEKIAKEKHLQQLREEQQSSLQPYLEKLDLLKQKLNSIDKIQLQPEKYEEKKLLLEGLLHEVKTLRESLKTLKERQTEEWSEIPLRENEQDPVALAFDYLDQLEQQAEKSSDLIQELINDRKAKQEKFSKVLQSVDGIQSWFDRANVRAFGHPIHTSNSRFVKEQLLDTINLLEELDAKIEELSDIRNQLLCLPDCEDLKGESCVVKKLDTLDKELSDLKISLKDRIRSLKDDTEKNEKRQKESQKLDANLADMQRKALKILKGSEHPSEEDVEIWQQMQKPSKDLQQMIQAGLQEQRKLVSNVSDQYEVLQTSLTEPNQKPQEATKFFTYTPLPPPVITREPGSSKILEAAIQKKVAELRNYLEGLKQNKDAGLPEYVAGQHDFNVIMSLCSQWLDCIENQASKTTDVLDLPRHTRLFRLIHKELLELLNNSNEIGQSLSVKLPASNTEQSTLIAESLDDLDQRLTLLEEETRRREQMVAERKAWQKNLDEQLGDARKLALDWQQHYLSLSNSKIPSEERLASATQLSNSCRDGLRRLDELKTEVQLRSIQDPAVVIPSELFLLRHQLCDLEGKITEKKLDLSRVMNSNVQYEMLLEQYADFVETAVEKVKTTMPSVKDLEQLKDQLSSHREFFKDLITHQTLLDSLSEKIEPNVKDRFHSSHTRLNALTRTALDKANAKEMQMKQAVNCWSDFEPQLNEKLSWLEKIKKRLPQKDYDKDSIEMLERKISDLKSILKDVEAEKESVHEILDSGRQLLALVSCPSLLRQIDDFADKHKKLNREASDELKSLEAVVKQLKQFELEASAVEQWMKYAANKKDSLNQILATVNQKPENLAGAENLLRDLKDELDDNQHHKTSAVAMGNRILQSRPSNAHIHNRIKKITDNWTSLGNDITDIEIKLQSVQKDQLPSRQALGELLQYFNIIHDSVLGDDGICPKNREDVQLLLKKYKSLKGDLMNLQLNVDYVNQVADQNSRTGTHSDQTLSAEQLGEMNRLYQALCSDVNSRTVKLELASDTWKEFEDGVQNLKDWLNSESVEISKEEENLKGNNAEAILMKCSELKDALMTKKNKDLERLQTLCLSLTKSTDWPADMDATNQMLTELNGLFKFLTDKVNNLKLSADRLKQCLDEYNEALAGVNNLLNGTNSSLNQLQQTNSCDSTSLREQIAALQVLQKNFDESAGAVKKLQLATDALTSTSIATTSNKVFQNEKKKAIDRWESLEKTIADELSSLQAISSIWYSYDQKYKEALDWLRSRQSELEKLLNDSSPENKEEKLKKMQLELKNFNGRVLEVDALSKELTPSLNSAQVIHIISKQKTLDELFGNLQQSVEQHLQNFESADGNREKFSGQCHEVEKFVKEAETILAKVSSPYDASDCNVVGDRLRLVKDLSSGIAKMHPLFQELNRSGYRLSLSAAESNRLKAINDRWIEMNSESKALEKKLQHQFLLLQSFSDKCDEWNRFLAEVEKNLSGDLSGDYSSMLNQQQMLQKFQDNVFPRQQVLYSIISDGHKMNENTSRDDAEDFEQKLRLLEEQWQTVVRRTNQRKTIVDNIMTLWQAYRELYDQLSVDLAGRRQFVNNHPVTVNTFDSLQRLLDAYTDALKQLETSEQMLSKLQSYLLLLNPNSDPVTMKQLNSDVQSLDNEKTKLNSEMKSNAKQLQDALDLWGATQTKMESFIAWLREIKRYLTPEVPTNYDALVDELKTLEELNVDKGDKCDELTEDLGKLARLISSEDSLLLCRRLRLLSKQQSEVSAQIVTRRQIAQDRLNRWTEFDKDVDDIMNNFATFERKMNELESLSIEDAIGEIQMVLQPELGTLEKCKVELLRDGKELQRNSKDLRATDVANKMARVNDTFARLKTSLNEKLNKLTLTLGTLHQLENSIKNLRLWLLGVEHTLSQPIIYETSSPSEIQLQLKKQGAVQKDIDDHNLPISSVLNLCDSLSNDRIACPSPAESQSLRHAKDSLESRWKKINTTSAERKHQIEETGQLWQKFNNAHQAFSSWLRSMEQKVVRPKTEDLTFNTMKEKLKAVQKLQGDIQANLSDLDSLNRLYCHLAHEGRTDAKKTLKTKIDDGNRRWDSILAKTDIITKQLSHIISVKDDFDANHQALMIWLSSFNESLDELEALGGKPNAKIIDFLKKQLADNSDRLEYVDRASAYLITKCNPTDGIQIQQESDDLSRLHLEILRRLKHFDHHQPSDVGVEDELSQGRIRDLEKKLEKGSKKDDSKFQAAVSRLEEDPEGLKNLSWKCLGDGDEDDDYIHDDAERRKGARPVLEDESSLIADLAAFEKWLLEANAVLDSERRLPQDMAQYDRCLKKHQDLTKQVNRWKPTAFQLQSALRPDSRQLLKTEGVRGRASTAVKRWDDLCRRVAEWLNHLQLSLNKTKEFHLNVEQMALWLKDVREDLTALDAEGPILATSPLGAIEARQDKLSVIGRDLEDIGINLEFLQNIADYFLRDSTSESAINDCQQLDKLVNDLENLKAIYDSHKALLDRATGGVPERSLLGSRSHSDKAAVPALSSGRRIPRLASVRRKRHGRSSDEGDTEVEPGDQRSYLGLLKRACRKAIPIQVMMLVLLGVASLVPMCENECVLNSLSPLLNYADGSPPI